MPSVLGCPFHAVEDFTTSYHLVVGERTCFPPNRSRRIGEIRDGLANTVMVVESNERVPWMAPFDPSLDEFVAEVRGWLPAKTPHRYSDLLTHYYSGGNCSLADGSIRHLHGAVDAGMLEKCLVIDDGALTDQEVDDFWHSLHSQATRVRWEGYLAVAAFLFVAILPAFWLIRRKTPHR